MWIEPGFERTYVTLLLFVVCDSTTLTYMYQVDTRTWKRCIIGLHLFHVCLWYSIFRVCMQQFHKCVLVSYALHGPSYTHEETKVYMCSKGSHFLGMYVLVHNFVYQSGCRSVCSHMTGLECNYAWSELQHSWAVKYHSDIGDSCCWLANVYGMKAARSSWNITWAHVRQHGSGLANDSWMGWY